ncbi:MAG: GntR family transcriptional regulator [Candidatus Binatia bacterium]|nr:GntR family transcriptional regulator [Candidatus Binatia bacterium]MDG1957973.1 GntR family transcriptional regulator [Candidatus Binatia bacterium]MDG2009592.1 GntR family transcriptional regulator [Candidatus Binatia bacterium]HAC81057.1 GntR family transcriptional regulator [Deltaproteobacteria bacterium]
MSTEPSRSARHQGGHLTQAETVRIGLESDILTGRLSPGSVIDETETSKQFGVSRTPVREAIFLLVQAGLIKKEARKRAIVAEFNVDDFFGLFETLAELEGLSARFATSRMSRAERFELSKIHSLAAEKLLVGEIDNYAALGRAFHSLILEGSKNTTLVKITSELAARLVPYRRFQVSLEGGLQRNQDDHEIILAAIRANDADAAYEAMRKHTLEQSESVIENIPAFSELAPPQENRGNLLQLKAGSDFS